MLLLMTNHVLLIAYASIGTKIDDLRCSWTAIYV